MKNYNSIILGLIFVMIALASLFIVLLWPHKVTAGGIETNKGIDYIILEQKSFGWPKVWMSEATKLPIQDGPANSVTSSENNIVQQKERKIVASGLLINLIVWAAFLTLVTFVFKAINRATRS